MLRKRGRAQLALKLLKLAVEEERFILEAAAYFTFFCIPSDSGTMNLAIPLLCRGLVIQTPKFPKVHKVSEATCSCNDIECIFLGDEPRSRNVHTGSCGET